MCIGVNEMEAEYGILPLHARQVRWGKIRLQRAIGKISIYLFGFLPWRFCFSRETKQEVHQAELESEMDTRQTQKEKLRAATWNTKGPFRHTSPWLRNGKVILAKICSTLREM